MPAQASGNRPSEELSYIDLLAMELASEKCIRCSGSRDSNSAAVLYEGLEWRYYYCYECRRWSMRHFKYRYAVVPLDDPRVIGMLERLFEFQREMNEARLDNVSWIRRKLSAASRFFQRFLPQ